MRVFPAWHIALTALVTAALTAVGTAAWYLRTMRRTSGLASRWSPRVVGELLGVGLASGLGVLLWRLGANVPIFNDDPIPGVSPADILSAPLAYVAADIYVRLRAPGASERVERVDELPLAPPMAGLIALVVNIISI